jgi:hypothetical protein
VPAEPAADPVGAVDRIGGLCGWSEARDWITIQKETP